MVVTHELESAFLIGDRIIVLDRGRLLAAGTSDEIRANQEERVVQFLNREADKRQVDTDSYLACLMGE